MKKFIAVLLALVLGIFGGIIPQSAAWADNRTKTESRISAQELTSAAQTQTAIEKKADDIIRTAFDLIGKATYHRYEYKPTYPYQFGCSGFIYYCYLKNGIDVNTRNTQFHALLGTYVPKDQLQKGDIVFFDAEPNDQYPVTHNGIYIGNNKIIHMADSINNIEVSDLSSKPYYRDYYVFARRWIPSYMPSAYPTRADRIVNTATGLIGKVTFGSANNAATLTFSNPGFVSYVYSKNGVSLSGAKYVSDMAKLGTPVARDQLKKGDLVFFSSTSRPGVPSVVAIYGGNYNLLINISGTGVTKRFMLIDYYKDNFVTARRVL